MHTFLRFSTNRTLLHTKCMSGWASACYGLVTDFYQLYLLHSQEGIFRVMCESHDTIMSESSPETSVGKPSSESPDSEDGGRTGCRHVSRQQQSFSGLQSPRWSLTANVCYSWVQTIFQVNGVVIYCMTFFIMTWSCELCTLHDRMIILSGFKLI